jgi:hypothetical protein
MSNEKKHRDNTAEEAFACGLDYGLQVVEFDSIYAQFELAIKIGDFSLQAEIAPKLEAATKKLREAHIALMARMGVKSDLLYTELPNPVVSTAAFPKERIN